MGGALIPFFLISFFADTKKIKLFILLKTTKVNYIFYQKIILIVFFCLQRYVFKWEIVGVYTLLTTEEIFRLVVSLIILGVSG